MSLPENKLEKFTSAVLKDAEDQRSGILHEIEEYKKSEMEKAEEEVLHESYIMIQNEIAAIKNENSKKISLAELDGRRKLLKLRDEISDSVFREAAVKILAFTKSPEYPDYLKKILSRYSGGFPEGKITIYVKSDDLSYKEMILSTFGKPAEIVSNPEIELGGLIILDHDRGIEVNETLDLKLSGQKDWFAVSSGLSIA